MKRAVIFFCIVVILSVAVYAAANFGTFLNVAKDVSIQSVQDCKTNYWEETQNVYGTCTGSYTETVCDDPPTNKSCHSIIKNYDYSCLIETNKIPRSEEVCNDKSYNIQIDKTLNKDTYSIDYSEFGKCSYQPGEDSVVIICDSNLDGNGDGICQPGESCISWIVSKNMIDKYYRNSRPDFVTSDDTFTQKDLGMVKVE